MTILQSSIASNVISGATGPTGATGPAGTNGTNGATGASPWVLSGSDTYYSAGNVGIGISSPSSRLTVGRVDSSNEGGQIDLCRASDNASSWAVDVFGNTSNPSFRIIDNVAAAARITVDGTGLTRIKNSVASNNGLEIGNSHTGTGASYGVKVGGGTNSSDYCLSGDNAAGTVNLFNFRGDGQFQFNSGYGSATTAYGCRAWVHFTASNGVRNGSGNVSSVTRNGTGDYTITFANAMSDGAYVISGTLKPTSGQAGNNARDVHVKYDTYPSTSSFRVVTATAGAGYEDPEYVYITVHR